jgi:hypothetical protein
MQGTTLQQKVGCGLARQSGAQGIVGYNSVHQIEWSAVDSGVVGFSKRDLYTRIYLFRPILFPSGGTAGDGAAINEGPGPLPVYLSRFG